MWLLAALLGTFSGGEERRPEMGVNGRGGLESEQINNRGELDCVSSASKLLLKLLWWSRGENEHWLLGRGAAPLSSAGIASPRAPRSLVPVHV